MEACRPHCIAGLDQFDGSPRELHGARRRAGLAGELGRPHGELGEVDLHELRCVRHDVPQLERVLEMPERLCEAEVGLRLARGLHRGEERVCFATCRRPMGRQLRGSRRAAPREFVGDPGMELLALAGQHRRVDGLCEQRVAEAEAARRRLGDENAVLHRPAQRLTQVALG